MVAALTQYIQSGIIKLQVVSLLKTPPNQRVNYAYHFKRTKCIKPQLKSALGIVSLNGQLARVEFSVRLNEITVR